MSFLTLTEQTDDPGSPASTKARMYLMNTGRIRVKQSDGTVNEFDSGSANAIVDFNYSLGKTTADSAHQFSLDASALAKIGNDSFWQADVTGGPEWASIDLGAAVRIDKIIVKHFHGTFDSDPAQVTSEFQIQWSDDNSTWTNYNHITGNTAVVNTYTSVSLTHRYWRILVTAGQSDTPPGLARVKRLELIQTFRAPLVIDGDGNVYVTNPDASVTYLARTGYLDLLRSNGFSDAGTPPSGKSRLHISSDGYTILVKDDAGNDHSVAYRGIAPFVQESTATVSNNTETTLAASGAGSLNYGGGLNTAGYVLRKRMRGSLSTLGSSPGTLTLNIYLEGVLIASTGAITPPTSLSAAMFELQADTVILTTGSSATVRCLGALDIFTGGARVSWPIYNQGGISTPVTVNLTVSTSIDIKSQFSVLSGNSISALQFNVEIVNQ